MKGLACDLMKTDIVLSLILGPLVSLGIWVRQCIFFLLRREIIILELN